MSMNMILSFSVFFIYLYFVFFFFQAEDGIRDRTVTGVQTCALPIFAYAAEEAERLNHRHIGTEHLLLGILREEKCVAAEILHERGLRLNAIREELARSVVDRQTLIKPKETPLLNEFSRDLTQAAMDGVLDPLVGRDN